jgi:catechol 2,3-dioxygenase-like lactoylglutathione lyase family enzyme
MGFADEGQDGPFTVMRVNDDFILLLGPWGAKNIEHYAFSMDQAEFDSVFERIKQDGVPYGDSFHNVGNDVGPGRELGARGMGATLYFSDPSNHLLEIRTYES